MFTSVVGLFDPGAGKHIKTELKQRLILNGQTIYLTRCLGKPQKNNGIFFSGPATKAVPPPPRA